jgi:hypothetical protein
MTGRSRQIAFSWPDSPTLADRYRPADEAGVADRSNRPQRSPRRTGAGGSATAYLTGPSIRW